MGKQKYMLTKSETSYSNFLAIMERQRLGLGRVMGTGLS